MSRKKIHRVAVFVLLLALSIISLLVVMQANDFMNTLSAGTEKSEVAETLGLALVFCFILIIGTCWVFLFMYRRFLREHRHVLEVQNMFFSKLTHEMRTSINMVMGFCRMAHGADNLKSIKNFAENIHSTTVSLRQTLDNMIVLSRIKTGDFKLNETFIDFRKGIGLIKSRIIPVVLLKNQQFIIEIDPQIPPVLLCDSLYIRQVIINILLYLLHYSKENAVILFKMNIQKKNENSFLIDFTLHSNQMESSPEVIGILEKESWSRIENSVEYGLFTSQQIVRKMGTRITPVFEAQKITGFGFSIHFDTQQIAASETVTSHLLFPLDLKDKKFLVADDSKLNQMILQNIFNDYGASLEFADNGEIACELFSRNYNHYSLIFMDTQMPEMDGYEATKKIRASGLPHAADIPIIAMTANMFKKDIEKAAKAGMNGYIEKPFEIHQIEEEIRKHLK
ncbi:MAG: response regulator [Fibrobacter sp.]|nr:response regulator [Fibrobacter sp.]